MEILKKKKLEVANLLTILATAASLLMTVVYATQYASSLEKRIALLEQHDIEFQARMNDMRDALFQANTIQDDDTARFQDNVEKKLMHMDDKIEKIYAELLKGNKEQRQRIYLVRN